MVRSFAFRPLLVLGLLAASACGDDDKTGHLNLDFRLANSSDGTCSGNSLGIGGSGVIDSVRVELRRGGEPIVEETAPCNLGNEIFVANAPVDRYDLSVVGLDPAGDVVMDNFRMPQKVEIRGGESQGAEAQLFPTPARILLKFEIRQNGDLQPCASTDVKSFDVAAWRSGGAFPLGQPQRVDHCDSFKFYVPDPDRAIEGASLDLVTIQPYNGSMAKAGPEIALFLEDPPGMGPPGAGKEVAITIRCDNSDCSMTSIDAVGSPEEEPEPEPEPDAGAEG